MKNSKIMATIIVSMVDHSRTTLTAAILDECIGEVIHYDHLSMSGIYDIPPYALRHLPDKPPKKIGKPLRPKLKKRYISRRRLR